jgi:glycogen debranching enzyme
MAAALGEPDLAASLEARAGALRSRFEDAFWREDLGSYALALDGENRPCDVRTSNPGQLLFTGICRPSRAERVARQLLGEEFFSGWGIRTVGAGEKLFNPTSYHNGSVWPHDNALFSLGLADHGLTDEALALCTALFDAGCHMHLRRLPELFCGFERSRGKPPTLYPVACAPQAWAACAPFALLQACLGLEIDAASATVLLRRPRLPEFLDWLRVRDLAVGASRLDVLFQRQQGSIGVNLLRRDGDAEVEVVL